MNSGVATIRLEAVGGSGKSAIGKLSATLKKILVGQTFNLEYK
jgi:hypothetical protein